MRGFYAVTEPEVLTEATYLTADIVAGVVALIVKDSSQFAANKYAIYGRLGEEGSEMQKLGTITDKTHIVTPATSFAHKQDDPIQMIKYNQRRFYRSTDGGVTYTLLETKDIEVDNPSGTYFEDSTGLDSYYYKATYYNSTEAVESDITDAVAASGEAHDVSLDEIRIEAGFKDNQYITDDLIYQKRKEAEAEVDAIIDIPSPTPDIVCQIIRDLAVGRLWVKDYGIGGADTSKDGYARLKDARGLLKQIAKGEYRIDNVSSQGGTGTFNYQSKDDYDNRTDEEVADDSKFSIHKEF